MSRQRLSFDQNNSSMLHDDTSMTLHHLNKETTRHPARNSSFDGTKQHRKSEDFQQLRKQNSYLQNAMNKFVNEQRSSASVAELSNENSELRMQRDQYLDQLNKNEEMLWKAREVISHLKSDMHLEALSKNLFNNMNQHNSSFIKPPRNENDLTTGRGDQKVKELTKKLQIKDGQIQELNQIISKVSLENNQLQAKLVKALEKIKELKAANQNKGDSLLMDYNQIQNAKVELEKKLDSTLQYNSDLFHNYSKLMKENSELQARLFAFEQQMAKVKDEVNDKVTNFSIIKAAESKIENLEHNISRIEETSFILPQLEQKLDSLKRLHKGKMDSIRMAIQLFHEEIASLIQSMSKNERQFLSELSTSQPSLATNRAENGKYTLRSLINSVQNIEIKDILEQLQPVKILKPLIQKLMKCLYDLAVENFHNNTARNLSVLEQKVARLERVRKSKHAVPSMQARSKSALAGRKGSNPGIYGGYNESNKENSFVNILNNSRF